MEPKANQKIEDRLAVLEKAQVKTERHLLAIAAVAGFAFAVAVIVTLKAWGLF